MTQHRTIKVDQTIIEQVARLDNKDGWIELAYEAGALEFTIIQLSFFGDWRVDITQLQAILDHATKQVTKP